MKKQISDENPSMEESTDEKLQFDSKNNDSKRNYGNSSSNDNNYN